MVCKKCKEVLPDDATVCTCCGNKIKQKKDKSAPKEKKPIDKAGLIAKIKLAGVILGLAIVIIAIITLVVALVNDNGKNTAETLSEYIGESMLDAINESNIKVADESKFSAVNNAMKFDYLVESEDSVKVDGINFPEWVITICLNEDEEIVTVTHTDFTVCEKNHKGKKADAEINLDNVKKNLKYKKVLDEIDLDPYSITYENAFVMYTYKYYYEDEAENEQAVRLTVTYNNDMEYQYYNSTPVYPSDI